MRPSATNGKRDVARLTALSDGHAYPIPADGLLIGRAPDCDVVLTSLRVSRRHARLVVAASGYMLLDDSTNGVVVNGVRVDGSIVLKPGDIIGVGETAFRFSTDGASHGPDRSIFASAPAPRRPAPLEPLSPTVPTETTPRAKRPEEPTKK